MTSISTNVLWESGDPDEYFMGRWSKFIAPKFLQWLDLPENLNWLDVGCGTGVLGEVINQRSNPGSLSCIDPSVVFFNLVHALGIVMKA